MESNRVPFHQKEPMKNWESEEDVEAPQEKEVDTVAWIQ